VTFSNLKTTHSTGLLIMMTLLPVAQSAVLRFVGTGIIASLSDSALRTVLAILNFAAFLTVVVRLTFRRQPRT
jgi:hypothetical protein